MIIGRFFALIFCISLLISCGGTTTDGSKVTPKDLNFNAQKTPEAYFEMILYAITSTRGNILADQFEPTSNIDVSALKISTISYAQAIRKKEWIREDSDLTKKNKQYSKEFRWLDKRRRLAIKISAKLESKDDHFNIKSLDFFSNIEILKNKSY